MLKRTTGRLLITLLVITGLAGTVNDFTLSKQERNKAIKLMKETRADAIRSVKGLSEVQFNFKTAPDKWSVRECMYHIAISEKNLWDMMESALKSPANPEKRSEIRVTDEQLVQMMQDGSIKLKTYEVFKPKNIPYTSLDDAIEVLKKRRADHINYMKSTTEDMHNHVVQMPFGWIDCYQLCLVIAAHSNRYTQQINEIKSDPSFPPR